MPRRYSRTTSALERRARSSDRFRFEMTLATEGEASDGHILSIRGGEIPARFPLLAVHDSWSLASSLGSVVDGEKDLRLEPPALRASGEINLDGEGDAADARRDVANLIDAGDLSAVSIRWEAIESVRRINLPSDHPAFVDPDKEASSAKRYGLFFKRWRALEGSVVPIGADAAAKIAARAAELEQGGRSAAASFMRALAAAPPEPRLEAVELVAEGIRLARASGVCERELLTAIAGDVGLREIGEAFATESAARELAELRRAVRQVSPAPAIESRRRAEAFTVDDLSAALSKHDTRLERAVERMLAKALGHRSKR